MTPPVVLWDKRLPFSPRQEQQLGEAFGNAQMVHVDLDDDHAVAAVLERAEIALLAGDLDARFDHAPSLQWVHCDHAGLTRSARPSIFARGILLTGAAGRSAPALAEHVMLFALALTSGFARFHEAQAERQWLRAPFMNDLRALKGRTIGLVGFGHIGREVAVRAKAFGMQVIAYRRRNTLLPKDVDTLFSQEAGHALQVVLKQADIVVLLLGLSDKSRHIIDADTLRAFKTGAFLINMGRGGLIDQSALIDALTSGHLAGAGLDVTDPEPLPPSDPLWAAPNVLITPHFTPALPDKVDRSFSILLSNVHRYRRGEELCNSMRVEDVWSGLD